jgi:hypothetical protein
MTKFPTLLRYNTHGRRLYHFVGPNDDDGDGSRHSSATFFKMLFPHENQFTGQPGVYEHVKAMSGLKQFGYAEASTIAVTTQYLQGLWDLV